MCGNTPITTEADSETSRPPGTPPQSSKVPAIYELPLPIGWIDPDAAKVLRRLRHCGYTAYMVGGCVRDLLLGRSPKDFDIATDALPREVKRAFSNCRLIGRRFRLAHIIFQNNIIEVATFRRDPAPSEGDEDEVGRDILDQEGGGPSAEKENEGSGKSPGLAGEEEIADEDERNDLLIRSDNVFGTPREDALRRDFTINGMFYDVSKSTLIDWLHGLEDVGARIIRTVGVPEVRFQEDPIRMLRAIKFASVLRFNIEPDTWRAIQTVAPDISRSAPPRILEEIFRMMRGGKSRRCFELMSKSDILAHVLPELAPLVAQELREEEMAAADTAPDKVEGGETSAASVEESEYEALIDNPEFDNNGGTAHVRPEPAERETSAEGRQSGDSLEHGLVPAERDSASDTGSIQSTEDELDSAEHPDRIASKRPSREIGGVLKYLGALDRIDQTHHPLSNHLLLAILCLVPVFRALKEAGHGSLTEQVFRGTGALIDEMGTRLRIARRDRERARLASLGLTKLLWRSERGTSVAALSRKSYFVESMILYSFHCLAVGTGEEDLRTLLPRIPMEAEFGWLLPILQQEFSGLTMPSKDGHEAGYREGRRRRRRRRSVHSEDRHGLETIGDDPSSATSSSDSASQA